VSEPRPPQPLPGAVLPLPWENTGTISRASTFLIAGLVFDPRRSVGGTQSGALSVEPLDAEALGRPKLAIAKTTYCNFTITNRTSCNLSLSEGRAR
jgi:hypothetical protein